MIRLLLLLLLLLANCFARRPNVVVIVADDLGYADVGFQGARDFDTPHIDRLAASGVRFTNGYVSHPYCSPTRAGILTGRYQQRFGHEHNPPYAPKSDRIGTPLDEVFLSTVMQEAGYRSAAIGKWHLGDAPQFLPHNRGFDEFFGFSGGGFSFYGTPRGPDPQQHILRKDKPVPPDQLSYLTDDFSDEAVRFIKRNRDHLFFIYLAYNAVHAPNHAPQRYLDRAEHIEYGLRSVYAAMTIAMDDGIGKVVTTLDSLGLREETLVIFVNDNGGRTQAADNRPLRGHKGLLYEGGVRVPFVMRWPGHLPHGLVYDKPVTSLDIFPTVAAAAGADTTGTKPLDGVNLIPFLTGENNYAPHDTLYWRVIGGQGYAVRHGDYKLVKPAARDEVMLFDLGTDPREIHNLAAAKPAIVKQLNALYESWNSELAEPLWTDPHAENVQKERNSVREHRRRALPPSRRD